MSEENEKETHFNNAVRENIVCLSFFTILYVVSSFILTLFWQNQDQEIRYTDLEDILISRISFGISAFSLAICFASSFLLPISIISNEILIIYPDNEYLNWLNTSLINSLWNHIYLLSNLCLFIMLPFAYFFAESTGFHGFRKGILNRFYETTIVCFLYGIMIAGISWLIFSTLLFDEQAHSHKLWTYIWSYYVPFSYHCISLFGVITLLVSTPIGFARIFDVIGELVIKPQPFHDLEDEMNVVKMQETYLKQRILLGTFENGDQKRYIPLAKLNQTYLGLASKIDRDLGHMSNGNALYEYQMAEIPSDERTKIPNDNVRTREHVITRRSYLMHNLQTLSKLKFQYHMVHDRVSRLKKIVSTSFWKRNINYPFAMVFLLLLTAISVVMVGVHSLELLVDEKALPSFSKHINIGNASLSFIGPLGAFMEVIIILYVKIASIIGFIGLPCVSHLKPRLRGTPFTKIIINCGLLLILTSAFPVLTRTLGITKFDLLGDFGKLRWLGNFYLVLFYNLTFVCATAWCLATKFTKTMKQELYNRLFSPVINASVFHGIK